MNVGREKGEGDQKGKIKEECTERGRERAGGTAAVSSLERGRMFLEREIF